MGKSHRRRFHRILILLFVALVVAGVVWYAAEEDLLDPHRLPRLPKPESLADGGQDLFRRALEAIKELLSRLLGGDGRSENEGPPPEPIKVCFGPCTVRDPSGIDDALVAFLESARESIYCAVYDLELQRVADTLIARHKAGVNVRIVTDSEYRDRQALRSCVDAGVPVAFDGRSAFMHNKFCVVDGLRVWTGSTNFTSNGVFANNNNSLLIDSPKLAINFAVEFNEMFDGRVFGRGGSQPTPHPELEVGGVRIECYFAPEDHVQREIIHELRDAERTIDFMAFSFTSQEIADAIAARIEHGVNVRGLFERRCAGSRYSQDDFLRAKGAHVFLDSNPDSMHHKAIILDAETVVTGSYNFSKAAEQENDENVLIVHDRALAEAFRGEFERLIL